MAADPEFCVCVLTYGDDAQCFKLAQRVFNESMLQLAQHSVEFRIGMNAVGADTERLITDLAHNDLAARFAPVIVKSSGNALKYPVMRQLFYAQPMRAPITIWFDDDSCLVPGTDVTAWLARIKRQLQSFAMLGSVYKQRLVDNQVAWIKTQWWYNNKEPQSYVNFITGGWWAIQTSVLLRFDWPLKELRHRGGDVMLGELCRQHDLPIGHFRDGLWINANEHGVESKSPRRGYDEDPIGTNFKKERHDATAAGA
jgi:hypothetical protein